MCSCVRQQGEMSQNGSLHVLRKVIIDCLLLGILIALIYVSETLQPFQRGFFCGDESLMFPYKPDTISSQNLKIYCLVLPFLAFLICEWATLRKDKEEFPCLGIHIPKWIRGFYCMVVSFSFGICFMNLVTNACKLIIGRHRPHYFDVCQPSIDCSNSTFAGRYITPDMFTCLGTRTHLLHDVNLSFLSGHSAWSAFSMVYLAMYVERRVSWSGTRSIRHVLQFLVLMLSCITALSRVSDFKHHWSDVLAGYCFGIVLAILVWSFGTDVLQKETKEKTSSPHADTHITYSL